MAESPAKGWRPLEPDAGNAAEGSEGPMPDWDFQPAIFRAWLFVKVTNQENRNAGRQLFLISFFLLS